jgi:hypothetical protein
MFSWAQIVLLGLELLNKLTDTLTRNKYISEGEALAIAQSQADILRKSQHGKQVLDEMERKSDSELDDFLREFEPK